MPSFGLDQRVRLAVRGGAVVERTDIERRMRPGRLGEILDDAGNVIVAFDQQHVAGPSDAASASGSLGVNGS